MPVRRIIEVAGIDPNTFYHRLDFLHRQCQAFAAHRERALANLAIRRLYLGVDRQDYLVCPASTILAGLTTIILAGFS